MINLLPPDLKQDFAAARSNTRLRRVVVWVLVLMIICLEIAGYGYIILRATSAQTQSIKSINQAQVDTLKDTATQANSTSAGVNTIGKLLAQKISFSGILTSIGKNTPSGAFLTNLQLDTQAKTKQPIVLTFRVDSQNTAAVLRNNLSSSGIFSSVQIQAVVKQDTADTSDDNVNNAQFPFEATLNVQPASNMTGAK